MYKGRQEDRKNIYIYIFSIIYIGTSPYVTKSTVLWTSQPIYLSTIIRNTISSAVQEPLVHQSHLSIQNHCFIVIVQLLQIFRFWIQSLTYIILNIYSYLVYSLKPLPFVYCHIQITYQFWNITAILRQCSISWRQQSENGKDCDPPFSHCALVFAEL